MFCCGTVSISKQEHEETKRVGGVGLCTHVDVQVQCSSLMPHDDPSKLW